MSIHLRIAVAALITSFALAGLAVGAEPTSPAYDRGFSGNGIAVEDFNDFNVAWTVDVDSRDRPVVGFGSGEFNTARFRTNGSLDTGFGDQGVSTVQIPGVNTSITSAVVDSHDATIEVGWADHPKTIAVVKLGRNGQPDSTFSEDGIVSLPSTHDIDPVVAVQPGTGKILVASPESHFKKTLVYKLRADGTLDGSFGRQGRKVYDFSVKRVYEAITAIQFDHEGRALFGLQTDAKNGKSPAMMVARTESSGHLDKSFSGNGKFFEDKIRTSDEIALGPRGSMYVAGRAPGAHAGADVGIVRLDKHGELVPSFGRNGLLDDDIAPHSKRSLEFVDGLEVRSGTLTVAGGLPYSGGGRNTDGYVARYDARGRRLDRFGQRGVVRLDFGGDYDYVGGLDVDGHGRPVIGGAIGANNGDDDDLFVARLKPNG